MHRVVQQLEDALGLGEAVEIVRRWGGRTLYVPVAMTEAHPIALTLGFEKARRLVAAFAGQRLELPSERSAMIEMRNAAICREAQPTPDGPGLSHEQLGIRWGLSRQMIANILRAGRECGA